MLRGGRKEMILKKLNILPSICYNVDIDPQTGQGDRIPRAKIAEDLGEMEPPEGFGRAKRVRIVHRGGVVEVFRVPITAGQVMGRYPRFYVTTPDVFRSPREAVVKEDASLTPGCKFFLVPMRSVEKLQSRQCAGSSHPFSSSSSSSSSSCNSADFATSSARFEPATSGPAPTCKKSKTASANASAMDAAPGAAGTASLNYSIRSDGSPVFCAKVFYSNPSNFRPSGNNCCKGGKSSASARGLNQARDGLYVFPPRKFNRACRGLAWYPKLSVIPELSP